MCGLIPDVCFAMQVNVSKWAAVHRPTPDSLFQASLVWLVGTIAHCAFFCDNSTATPGTEAPMVQVACPIEKVK